MRPNLLLRTTRSGACSTSFPGLASRTYSSQTGLGAAAAPKQRRQSITPFNDNGSVPWRELSVTEKMARTTQQGFNGGLIAIGLVLTGTVVYFLWTDVFSPDSKVSQFNRAVDRIKKDARYSEKVDARGDSHLMMHFYVDGPLQDGVAQLHMVKRQGESDYEYRYFFVDVKGHDRVYLEKASPETGAGKKQLSLFGVKWGR
ncbi:hypothetical protein CDD80_6021 [Ophiocordyceps camponoti-rufipedis]|uniref:Mitochondrial import inner membrane translocase subunit Tim21 n=1 Tax=Ophiocordyceps camponoti-rufipedis TaxID=2004952 RepID=A0A2C5YS10_9HYPO|nr:hypothetical protein CDD80_6021 [Ophiocordyceps camponoti-rufipedis]